MESQTQSWLIDEDEITSINSKSTKTIIIYLLYCFLNLTQAKPA